MHKNMPDFLLLLLDYVFKLQIFKVNLNQR